MRVFIALFAAIVTAIPCQAIAQAWSVQGGAAMRGEYSDNYFFTPVDPQSGFTASITPFVTASRRTETSDVSALLAVGVNKVWGLSENVDYLGGRFGLDGTLRDARSTWKGGASFVRAPNLQSELRPTGVVLGLVNTSTATLGGTYNYALAERWSLGASAGGYGNRYTALESSGSSLPSNRGYDIGGEVGYALSSHTKMILLPVFSHFASDITRSDYATTTLSIVHQFSPQLTVSGSLGGFWSDIESVNTGDLRRDNGQLYGGKIAYSFSERTQFLASLSEGLAPSGTGTITRNDSAGASLSHRFSDHLTGWLGVSYTRTKSPDGLSNVFTTRDYRGEIGFSYLLVERWRLDAGYRYARAQYSQDPFEPKSNVAFLSIGYNWPGASLTDWIGKGTPGTPASPENSPFDRYSIP